MLSSLTVAELFSTHPILPKRFRRVCEQLAATQSAANLSTSPFVQLPAATTAP